MGQKTNVPKDLTPKFQENQITNEAKLVILSKRKDATFRHRFRQKGLLSHGRRAHLHEGFPDGMANHTHIDKEANGRGTYLEFFFLLLCALTALVSVSHHLLCCSSSCTKLVVPLLLHILELWSAWRGNLGCEVLEWFHDLVRCMSHEGTMRHDYRVHAKFVYLTLDSLCQWAFAKVFHCHVHQECVSIFAFGHGHALCVLLIQHDLQ